DDALAPTALLGAASAWYILLVNGAELPEKAADSIAAIFQQLWALFEASKASGDVQSCIAALRLYASLTEAAHLEGAEQVWQLVEATCQEYQQYPSTIELLPLAHYAYQRGDARQGRRYLLQLPVALAVAVGAAQDLWAVSQGQILRLKAPL